MGYFRQVLAALGLVTILCIPVDAGWAQDAGTMRLVVLGDLPYGVPEAVYPPYKALIEEINARAPDLVVHVGDTKGGGACSDEILTDQLNFMNSFAAPLLYTPGDNEWTDCHRFFGDTNDPLDRLDFIRRIYFAEPGTSLGQNSVAVEHQGDEGYPENARFRAGEVGIITAHIVGSNNNFETREISAVEEYSARSAASNRWLREGFAAFAETEVIVVAIHADMFEFDFNIRAREEWPQTSGFREFGLALKDAARGFGKPVLLLFGDSHIHRVFRPFPQGAPNVTGVETFGYPDMHAVEVAISPGAAEPFGVTPVWNPATGK